jgi:hypothetical protein
MKKIIVSILLLTGTGKFLPAQETSANISTSEFLFNYPKPGGLYNNFTFYLNNGNKMTLEMASIHQLKKLPNLDSLAKKVYEGLQPFKDSLSKELTTKRVDYVIGGKDVARMRITEHQPSSNYYTYKDGEPLQMKVDQDTLRIKLFIKTGKKDEKMAPPCFVTFIVNNISDINNIPENALNKGLNDLLIKDIAGQFKADPAKYESGRYYAVYKLETNERLAPKKVTQFAWGRSSGLDAYMQLGIQYLRGSWVPSTGVGVTFFQTNTRAFEKKSYSLFWEPYFFFSRDASNNSVVDRNDFITFKFHSEFKNYRTNALGLMYQNISVGYLINRKGNWFEKNTFKFSLPGLQTKNILLEPEFYFNDFFKNCSPSLKLTLFFE